MGATILSVCKGVNKILVGGRQPGKSKLHVLHPDPNSKHLTPERGSSPTGGVCDHAADEAHAALLRGVSLSRGSTAILARSNVTVFTEAVQLTSRNPNTRIHFVGVSRTRGTTKWFLCFCPKRLNGRPAQLSTTLSTLLFLSHHVNLKSAQKKRTRLPAAAAPCWWEIC